MRIGIFDSGIGGLTVLKSFIDKYPFCEYIYFGDTQNIPYGEKSIEELKFLSSGIIEFLIEQKVDIIVIACGTLSSTVYDYLKNNYDIPIYDIISPVINYINNCEYKNIGVIATKRTIKSNIFSNTTKSITAVSCPKFVPIIESGDLDIIENCLDEYLYLLKKCDLVILGCTHYPLIEKYLNRYFNNKIKLLNMADCIPRIKIKKTKKSVKLYFSLINDTIKNNIDKIIKYDYIKEIKSLSRNE